MSILIDNSTRLLVQGITGSMGAFSARDMRAYGTRVVGGVVPGKGGTSFDDLPVFDAVAEAQGATGADASIIYVPAGAAVDAILEALDAGIKLIVYPGDLMPVHDAILLRRRIRRAGAVLVGPNSPGLISPGKCKIGFMPSFCFTPGPLGVISKSGSLSYEFSLRLTQSDLGQSTVVGIGGDPIKGLTAEEALRYFHDDPETAALFILGEIGGYDEYAVADYARSPGSKPVAAYLVGQTAPPGKRMGHAGALISSSRDTWEAKRQTLEEAGVPVATRLAQVVSLARDVLRRAGVAVGGNTLDPTTATEGAGAIG